MKYFLIAGEASGDKHAAGLMAALRRQDEGAEFCFVGGTEMIGVGGTCIMRYEDIAYMGFAEVATHLGVILRAMARCKRALRRWQPDVVIMVDYPGFNLSIARYAKKRLGLRTFYYISPKVWAWKEGRVKQIKRWVDELFSILPFEVDFYEKKHGLAIHYVGNPSVDEVEAFKANFSGMGKGSNTIALLPGSRRAEVKSNLQRMIATVDGLGANGWRVIVCGVSSLSPDVYAPYIKDGVEMAWDKTYEVLSNARAALVVSGTATLEVALWGVPQVVCYYAKMGRLVRALKPHFLKVKFISLVNLIIGREIVPELIGDEMNPDRLRKELEPLIGETPERLLQLRGYEELRQRIGGAGCAERCAREMLKCLKD